MGEDQDFFVTGKRDRSEIVCAIIAVSQRPTSFTSILMHANLNYSELTQYTNYLLSKNLLQKNSITRRNKKEAITYQATEKGNKFLENFCENLILLHGTHFIEINRNLAEAYLDLYYRKNRLQVTSKLSPKPSKTSSTEIKKIKP